MAHERAALHSLALLDFLPACLAACLHGGAVCWRRPALPGTSQPCVTQERPLCRPRPFACSYMDGGRIAFSGSPDEMRAYMRRLGALV